MAHPAPALRARGGHGRRGGAGGWFGPGSRLENWTNRRWWHFQDGGAGDGNRTRVTSLEGASRHSVQPRSYADGAGQVGVQPTAVDREGPPDAGATGTWRARSARTNLAQAWIILVWRLPVARPPPQKVAAPGPPPARAPARGCRREWRPRPVRHPRPPGAQSP